MQPLEMPQTWRTLTLYSSNFGTAMVGMRTLGYTKWHSKATQRFHSVMTKTPLRSTPFTQAWGRNDTGDAVKQPRHSKTISLLHQLNPHRREWKRALLHWIIKMIGLVYLLTSFSYAARLSFCLLGAFTQMNGCGPRGKASLSPPDLWSH